MSKTLFTDSLNAKDGITIGAAGSWRFFYDEKMQSGLEDEDTHMFWDDTRAIRVTSFTMVPEPGATDQDPLSGNEDYQDFQPNDKFIRAKIKHWQEEEDGEPYWITSLVAAFGHEVALLTITYEDPTNKDKDKDWALEVCASLTRTSEMEVMAGIDFRALNTSEIISKIFTMNMYSKSKSKHLAQTLYFESDGGMWNVAFPQTNDDFSKVAFWTNVHYAMLKQDIKDIIIFSDMTMTDVDSGEKSHALVLHYLNRDGKVIVKQCNYVKKMFKKPVFGEIVDGDTTFLPYWLEPIAKSFALGK